MGVYTRMLVFVEREDLIGAMAAVEAAMGVLNLVLEFPGNLQVLQGADIEAVAGKREEHVTKIKALKLRFSLFQVCPLVHLYRPHSHTHLLVHTLNDPPLPR
jgi:hypothetical protein